MAHYAYLDDNNIVVDIIVGKDETESIDGMHPEIYYAQGTPYTVKRTSYNGRIRYNYASLGDSYDANRNAFISPKCHDEAILDEAICRWTCTNKAHDDID